MRIGALRVPSDDSRRYRRAEGLASGVKVHLGRCVRSRGGLARMRVGSGSGRAAGASARRHRRVFAGLRRGDRATCHCAASALLAPWSPTLSGVAVLLSARRPDDRRRALHRPAALRLPPRPAARARPAPKNFPHRAGKIDCAASPE